MTLALILLLIAAGVAAVSMLAWAHRKDVTELDEQLAAADAAVADHHRPARVAA